MNKKIVVAFVIVFCIGTFIGYAIPYLLPKNTIYDKLREAQIIFSEDVWQEHYLQEAKNFQQIENLEEFKQIYEVYYPLNSRPTSDIVQVKVDSDWNMVWICWWTVVSDVAIIEYLGFFSIPTPIENAKQLTFICMHACGLESLLTFCSRLFLFQT